jgi:hypothetical protein
MIPENIAELKSRDRNYWAILVSIGAVILGAIVSLGFQFEAVFLIWFSTCCTTGILLINRWYQGAARNLLLRLFVIGFVIRVAIALVVYFHTGWLYRDPSLRVVPGWGHVDAASLMEKATNLVSVWRSSKGIGFSVPNLIDTIGGLAHSYAIFNALHLLVFGKLGEFLPLITNCALGALLPVFTFRIGRRFLNHRIGKLSAYFVAFDPLLIFYSVLNLKEIPAAFLLTTIVVAYFDLLREVRLRSIIIVVLLSVALVLVRIYVLVVLLIAILVSLFFKRLTKSSLRKLFFLTVVSLIVIIIPQTRRFLANDIIGRLTSGNLSEWSRGNVALAAERGFFLGQFRANLAFTYAMTAAHFLISPSPYRMRLAISDMTRLGMVLWGVLFPYFVFGFLYAFRHRESAIWLMVIFIVGLVAAYTPFPLQASVRHRVQMMPFAYLITATGIVHYHHRHKKRMRYLMWMGVFVGLTLFEFMF